MNEEDVRSAVEDFMQTHAENREKMLRTLLFHTLMGHELVLIEVQEKRDNTTTTSYKHVFRTRDHDISDDLTYDVGIKRKETPICTQCGKKTISQPDGLYYCYPCGLIFRPSGKLYREGTIDNPLLRYDESTKEWKEVTDAVS